jgi:hypothetical protein
MVSSDDEQPRLLEHPRQEMVACGELRSKLAGWIDRRVDVPAEPFLRRGERTHDVLERRLANH